ncbi:hypothetical protein MMC26_001086 [Xylographa opegraphella]|nr:hypothetical protein [Xylographa opegraphella]
MVQPSSRDNIKNDDNTMEQPSIPTSKDIIALSEEYENVDIVKSVATIPSSNLNVPETRNPKTLPASALSDKSSLVSSINPIMKDDSLCEPNILRIGSEDKIAQLQRYLFHPENTGYSTRYEEIIIFPARIRFPGEHSFSLETGEPAIAPSRRPLSPKSKSETAYTRRKGACDSCRARKKKCLHRLREQEDTTIASARNRTAFDYPTRRRRHEIDSISTGEESVSEETKTTTSPNRRTSSIRYGDRRARKLPTSNYTRIRVDPLTTSPTSGPSIPVGSSLSREVLPESQIATTLGHGTRALDVDQFDHFLPIRPHYPDLLGRAEIANSEHARNTHTTPCNGTRTSADQLLVPIANNASHEHDPHTASPSFSQTRTAGNRGIDDHNPLQYVASQAANTPMLMGIPDTGPSDSAWAICPEQSPQSSRDIQCHQVREIHTTTESQVTLDEDYSQWYGAYTPANPATVPGQAFSMAIATRQQSQSTPDIELLEPYGPGDLNLYGDFPWLDNDDIEKSAEMDVDLSWEAGRKVPCHSGFSVESGNSTSGSSLTPPSDNSGKEYTAQ